jgi:hypothetical protein
MTQLLHLEGDVASCLLLGARHQLIDSSRRIRLPDVRKAQFHLPRRLRVISLLDVLCKERKVARSSPARFPQQADASIIGRNIRNHGFKR